ncbi:HEAT repeat domain-containing protein [Streptomyces sp. Caat 7-52]|uniref:HEAT repeat domain-containing protein n=1 Tax=Streptomyces sp. Caat 7-52 TaxID=2949637 RepID=UPI002034AAC8|nr:HEAT repeat domain-containing protein [Streptomyces sp. Caat 7-52]
MSGSPYSALRARLASRTVEHYLRPTFRVHNSADDSGERLRFDSLLDQLPAHRSKPEPRPRTWLVTGGAGSGKSTAVLQYAIALLDRETPCVIVDNRTIRQLDVHGLTVKEFARQSRPSGVDEPLWKAHVKKNRVVFLVDALNELEREFRDTPEWKFIWQLAAGSHDFTVLATSRSEIDDLDRTILRDVETISIEPLGEQDIETYLGMRDRSATEALAEIRSGDMLGVASNPFMLSLLTDWLLGTRSVKDREIPRSRADLLRATVVRPKSEGRLGRAEKDAATKRGLGMEAALCAAALAAITTGKGNADFLARDVEALLGRVWEDRDEIAHTVQAFLDTQMVEPVGDAADGQYSLIHPAFVDFGLALAWQSTSPPPVALDPAYLDRCLGDWVGLQPDPDSAVLDLLAPGTKQLPPELVVDVLLANRGVLGDEVRGVLWRQLGRCFTQGRQIRDRLAGALASLPATVLRDGLQRGLLRALNAKDPDFADDVIAALANGSLDAQVLQRLRRAHQRKGKESAPKAPAPDPTLVAKRRASLHEQADPLARRRTANWLSDNGGEQNVDDLRTAMRDDPDARVRGASATALGRIGSLRAVPALMVAAAADPDPIVRGSATNALGHIGHAQAVPALTTALADDTDAIVRGSAANALGHIGHAQAVPALTTALADDTDAIVRGSAANALGRIGHPQAVRALTTALAEAGEAKVRGAAANALGHIGHPDALDALTTALAEATEANVRGAAANALGRIGHPDALDALTRALTDPDAIVRGSATNALGRIGHPDALDALTRTLTDPDASVRGSAANALGQIGHPQAVPALTTALADDTEANVRGSAANALGRISDPQAVPALTTALADDPDSHTRGSTAEALGRIGHPEAVPALTDALTDDDAIVRGSAANALGRIGHPDALEALTTALADDSDANVRGSAANALGHIGHPQAIPALVTALAEDTEGNVRGSAANAFGHLGDTAAAEVLRATIGNPEETYQTRRAAVGSLTHLDTGDEAWITEVADRLKFTARDRHGRALRGAIVDMVARREITPQTKDWLVGVIRRDKDPLNRTTALEGLARAGQADADLIKFIIAPEQPRPDKRPRDSDAGVLGVAAAAVVRAAADQPAYTESLLPSVIQLLTQKNTYRATVIPPLTQLRLLPLPVANRVFSRIEELLGDTAPENAHLEAALTAERESLAERRRVQADVESFTRNPEAVLAGFREQRKSRFEVTAPGTGDAYRTAPRTGDEYHVALLTAVPVETKALFRTLDERHTSTTEVQRDGRYYDVFELASTAGQAPVRVVTTQATDQGGQSAAAVTRDLLSKFRPDLVLLVGVCGGFAEHGVALGDVLLAREVFDYGPEKVSPEGGGLRPQVYRTDEQVLRLVTRLDTRGRLDASLGDGELRVKDFASGEKVIAWRDSGLRAQLLGLSADIGGVETEAHGVLHAIWEAFKAKDFVGGAMLKCVSDLGDEEMTVDKKSKQTDAAQRAARVALDVAAAFRRADA